VDLIHKRKHMDIIVNDSEPEGPLKSTTCGKNVT
jgi:hypothetical protein